MTRIGCRRTWVRVTDPRRHTWDIDFGSRRIRDVDDCGGWVGFDEKGFWRQVEMLLELEELEPEGESEGPASNRKWWPVRAAPPSVRERRER